MLAIPSALQAQFEECLRNKAIPNRLHGAYKKWLRSLLSKSEKDYIYSRRDAEREIKKDTKRFRWFQAETWKQERKKVLSHRASAPLREYSLLHFSMAKRIVSAQGPLECNDNLFLKNKCGH